MASISHHFTILSYLNNDFGNPTLNYQFGEEISILNIYLNSVKIDEMLIDE